MHPTLDRSPTDKMIGGVCGGLGSYLAIDPVLIRLFFVLLTLGAGAAETLKADAADIAARGRALGEEMRVKLHADTPVAGLIIGVALVLLGRLFVGQKLRIAWLSWLDFSVLWPILLIAGGVTLIGRRTKGVHA